MDTLIRDARYAIRSLRRDAALSAAALVTIALAVGASTAIFTVADAVLLRPLPFRDSAGLVHLWETQLNSPTSQTSEASYPDFLDWRDRNRAFEGLAGYQTRSLILNGVGEPARLAGARVTANFFDLLGVIPTVGRGFVAGEDAVGAPAVALLSYGLWRGRFGGDPAIAGRVIQLNSVPTTVLGVLPAGFDFGPARSAELYLAMDAPAEIRSTRGHHFMHVIGRLRPGVDAAAAERMMATIMAELAREHPAENAGRSAIVVPLRDVIVRTVRPALLTLMGSVALVLCVACANVTTLLLSRATARRRELAVRTALGASRGRLVREQLTLSLLLVAAGGVVGSVLAVWGTTLLVAAVPAGFRAMLPALASLRVDLRMLALAVSATAVAGIAVGLVPALHASRCAPGEALSAGGRATGGRGDRLRHGLVVAEIALTLTLLIGAGLMAKSLGRLLSVELGFIPERVLTVRTALPAATYPEPARIVLFYDQLLDRVRALRPVRGAALTTKLPLDAGNTSSYVVEGVPALQPGEMPDASIRMVSDQHFKTLGIPLLEGREFTRDDDADAPPVIIVNGTLARKEFGGGSAIGHRLLYDDADSVIAYEIVGVVADARTGQLDAPATPTVYFPMWQDPQGAMALAVRTTGDPRELLGAVAREVRGLDPDLPLFAVSTMDEMIASSIGVVLRRLPLGLMAVFAGVCLLLAIVGITGVVSYDVIQRAREIGIRIALGAEGRHVFRLVMTRGLGMAAAGVGTGALLAYAGSRVLRTLLFEVEPADGAVYLGSACLLAAVAAAASYFPARRATQVEPVTVLRSE